MITSFIKAVDSNSVSVEGNFTTNAVKIELKQYENNGGILSDYNNSGIMNIDSDISMIPRIKNLGVDCYIRAKIDFTVDGINNEDYYLDVNSNWLKQDDYYYYKNVLLSGNSVDLFTTFKLKKNEMYNHIGDDANLNIRVEAVQAKNFDVDFNRINIWQYVDINECIDNNYDINSSVIDRNVTINNGISNAEFTIPKKFFEDISTLLPGDKIEETIKIDNISNTNIDYYIKNNPSDNIKNNMKLIKLQILDDNNNIIYEGPLYIEDRIHLGKIKKSISKNYIFKVSVPADFTNDYLVTNGCLSWNFYVENEITNPETLDNVITWIILFIISLFGFIITMFYKDKLNY